MKKFSVIICLLIAANSLFAQEDNLRLQFDFETFKGATITDNVSGISAKRNVKAAVVEMGDQHVFYFNEEDGYLDLTQNTGKIVRNLTDFTISVYYCVEMDASLDGNGYFLWSFSQIPNNTETSSKYSAYRLNAQRYAASTAGYGSEVGLELAKQADKGHWMHLVYRQTANKGEIIINGVRQAYANDMLVLKNTFSSSPAYCWIGRPPFLGDNYLHNTFVDDFRIYDVAITDDKIKALAENVAVLEQQYRYGTPGDFTQLVATLQQCSDFMENAGTDYPQNALLDLSDVMSQAQKEVNLGKLSQAIIDQYVELLKEKLQNAVNSKGFALKPTVDFHSGQQGFVHPGALVTQEDIDRAKRMISQGDERMVRAWEILCNNQYAQANVATWPTEYIVRGIAGDNYMNAARGAAMAFQNALRWKIGGTKEHADAAVRILMQWCNTTVGLGGNTNISLASGLYGYEFANAAELMRDYEGWPREDFEKFKKWMVKVFYNPAIDFLRRRHDTWMNFRHPDCGERPGHYWSNWGLCNVLSVMSIGILCDDVHMYNQGVSFYKYDHQGTFQRDRSQLSMIINDGCNEFIGNLVPVVLPDERGPLGFLGQMQESGRDQGHALMALGCALDVCQIGFNQGDDLFYYMDDRIAAGTEYVAAQNFCGVQPTDLPWIVYEYADCAGKRGASWQMPCADSRGVGEWRPMWDRVIGYYQGLRGVKIQYAQQASNTVGPDGGGGNYSPNSGGFDHLGFTTLTHWRPMISADMAITPLSGYIIYKGETLKEQTNLGGLKYRYEHGPTTAIPADGEEITLVPILPEGTQDTGMWLWNTGQTTKDITVKADHSFIYRVTYTAQNGTTSQQAFAIAVTGDAEQENMRQTITANNTVINDSIVTVLKGTSLTLFAEAVTGWTDDYVWDNGMKGTTIVTPAISSDRTYTCQFTNQAGVVSNANFHIYVVDARQHIIVDGADAITHETEVFKGADVELMLEVENGTNDSEILWQDGSTGRNFRISDIQKPISVTVKYNGHEYVYNINVKEQEFSYYSKFLTNENGYQRIANAEQLADAVQNSYFVICANEADLMLALDKGVQNANMALFYNNSDFPENDFAKVFTLEPFEGGYCIRNIDYDGLLLQTEMNAAWNFRTHDQPYPISWARFLFDNDGSAWTVENGTYGGNWLGLWTPENGFNDNEELACNKTGNDIAKYQIFAIKKADFHHKILKDADEENPVDATVIIQNPSFEGYSWALWNVTGSFGNQRFNGAAETWHSTDFKMTQSISGLPEGIYELTCQMANGEGENTGYLFASADNITEKAVVKQSCAGSDFDTQRNKMEANPEYAKLSVQLKVKENGNITFGIVEPTNETTWLVFDNFKLTYKGNDATAIHDVHSDNGEINPISGYYDLSGRNVNPNMMGKGVYIINGKKVIIQ